VINNQYLLIILFILQTLMCKSQHDVEEHAMTLVRMIDEQRQLALKEIEHMYTYKQTQLSAFEKRLTQYTDKLSHTIEFTRRLLKYSSVPEVGVSNTRFGWEYYYL
jgi:hypothetical protein